MSYTYCSYLRSNNILIHSVIHCRQCLADAAMGRVTRCYACGLKDGFVIFRVSLVGAFLISNSLSFPLLTAPAEIW